MQTLNNRYLVRVWGNRRAWALLVGVYVNGAFLQDDLEIPLNSTAHIAFDPAIPPSAI